MQKSDKNLLRYIRLNYWMPKNFFLPFSLLKSKGKSESGNIQTIFDEKSIFSQNEAKLDPAP